ncbi:FtsQ-type POTRA domain-containing protein [Cryobacterium sp. N19]|uniref:FtsQ-type POTRA domain-containing protein n=1 Tax=Cryobacterium sp. N19 TaxID=2048288 RepID=UPI001E48773A|nr:FtsQ-type POTRA domain-containing protein [Cryobacterium sp. N19]
MLAGGGASASRVTVKPVPSDSAPSSARAGRKAESLGEASGGTPGARAARSVLRAAQRARKRFERAEVRRFTGRTRRQRTAWILGVGSIVLAFGLIIGAAYSPLMALRTIEVVGTSRIPAADVSAALADQLGTPLPLIDSGVVKGELSKFTLIQSYVTESRPPGTLVVRIVERVPVGVLTGPTGFDLVDAAGVVIETTPERAAGYPLIDAPDGISSAGFKAAAAVLAVLPESIRTQLDSVTAVTTDDVTLSLLGGERVVWGSPEKSEYKAVVLAALLVGHPAGTVNEYDVSSPDSAVLR